MAGVQHVFNGSTDECVFEFIDNFKLVAQVSGWENSVH